MGTHFLFADVCKYRRTTLDVQFASSSNSSFYYVRIEALATDVESAKKLCLKYLASRIELEQSVRISEVSMTTDETTSTMENGRFRENIVTKSNYSFRVEGTPVNLTAKLVDEFLVETIVGGKRMLKMNTLYAVARKGYPLAGITACKVLPVH